MSLKSIDMQIAAHKNSDLGQLQSQLQQKAAADQSALAAAGMRAAEVERRKSPKVEDTPKSMVGGRDADGRRNSGKAKGKASPNDSSVQDNRKLSEDIGHPYKGHHIDLTL